MDIEQMYATTVGGFFVALLLLKYHSFIRQVWKYAAYLISKYLTYPHLLGRHRILGPWTPAGVLAQLAYVMVNLFCIGFRTSSMSIADVRARSLALINLVPVFAGLHLSFSADFLGVSLSTYKLLHRSAGLMSCALITFHVLTSVSNKLPFPLTEPAHLFGVVGASSLSLLILLCYPLFRKLSYEIFLRLHLAVLCVISVWHHTSSHGLFPRLYVYIITGLSFSIFLLECGIILYHNGVLGYGFSRAMLTCTNNTVKISISLSRPIKVEPGQYINLWIPSIRFWSSHPFMVVSSADEMLKTLELLVVPSGGFTRELLRHAEETPHRPRLLIFSGPHGSVAGIGKYESVLMIASGSGIAAKLPYLRQLVRGHGSHKVRTRRIHLIWELHSLDVGLAAQSSLQEILEEDINNKILNVSVYSENINVKHFAFGTHATVYKGSPDLEQILKDEIKEKVTKFGRDAKVLVTVSGTKELRDFLQSLIRRYLQDKITLLKLEYQPTKQTISQRGEKPYIVKSN